MSILDNLPQVDSFVGMRLKTGCFIIAVIGIVYPLGYVCTLCAPASYLLLTIRIIVAAHFFTSILLLCGLLTDDATLCVIWIWYSLFFVLIMLLMKILLTCVFMSKAQISRALLVILGMLYYILFIYFIFVVNSYYKNIPSLDGK